MSDELFIVGDDHELEVVLGTQVLDQPKERVEIGKGGKRGKAGRE